MPVPVPDEARRRALHRVLPVGGLLVFCPGALVAFDRAVMVSGMPLLVVYLFGAWIVGIALTAWLASAETPHTPDGEAARPTDRATARTPAGGSPADAG